MKKLGRKLYIKLFRSIGILALIFGLIEVWALSSFFGYKFNKQVIGNLKNTLTASVENLQERIQQAQYSAFSLMYSDAAQKCFVIDKTMKASEISNRRSVLLNLMRAVNAQSPKDIYYTIITEEPYATSYSNIESNRILNYNYNFLKEDWFRDFLDREDERLHLYSNISMDGYTNISFGQTTHVYVIRSNNINTLETNGYVLLQFTDKTIESLLGALPDTAVDILVTDAQSNILYQNLTALSAETLIDHSTAKADNIYETSNNYTYIPMCMEIPFLGWTIYCSIDAKPITNSISSIINASFCIQAFFLTSLLIVILFEVKRISRPLQDIAKSVKGYHNGLIEIHTAPSHCEEVDALVAAMNELSDQLQSAQQKAMQYKTLEQSTAFYALQQQINPHFLYNTLDMIIGMATLKDSEAIITSCSCLSAMFRYTLSRDTTVFLREEMQYIRNYMVIISLRSQNRITAQFNYDEKDSDIAIPKLILQPFIENSVKHGFDKRLENCIVGINIHRSGSELLTDIWDNGSGYPESKLRELNEALQKSDTTDVPALHIGIVNVYQRLRIIYGDAFSIQLENRKDGGALVHLRMPEVFPNIIL